MKLYAVAGIILLAASTEVMGQTSFWTDATVPATPQETTDSAAVNLGLKFYSEVPGAITGVRFYKGGQNTGEHTGVLWSSAGTKLASVVFTNETGSGWQTAKFATPVPITANTTYVVSYLAPQGNYADDTNYAWWNLKSGPLHASGGAAGVYVYGSTVQFPTSTWNRSNYYVDVLFEAAGSTQPSTYSISGNVSGSSGATLTLSGASGGQTSTDGSGNYTFSALKDGSYVVAPSKSGYTFSPATASVTIAGASKTGVNFAGTAVPPTVSRSVTLTWTASATPDVTGYNVYRAATAGGPYQKITSSPVNGTSFTDTVQSGLSYYYVATSVNGSGESSYSTEATAVVP